MARQDNTTRKSKRAIARDQMAYLRENPSVCADGNAVGTRWVRYYEDEWRAATYGGPHRLKTYVDAELPSEDWVLNWFESKPVTIKRAVDAELWSGGTVWDDADDQDAFTDARRCFWCGVSEWSEDLTTHQTVEQGECNFCSDCLESWERAGEIVEEKTEANA